MKMFKPLLLTAVLFAAPSLPFADTLLLDAIGEAPENSQMGVPRPITGQTMDDVRNNFGQAQKEFFEVGDPPITRWVYESFTVYFEYKRVINTVVHR